MKDETTIYIIDHRGSPWTRWFRSIASVLAMMLPGVFLESIFLQSLGMLFLAAFFLSLLMKHHKDNLTIEEARARLDQMERGE